MRKPDDISKGRIGLLQSVEDCVSGGIALDVCVVTQARASAHGRSPASVTCTLWALAVSRTLS